MNAALMQPIVNTLPVGPNPPLIDVFDADQVCEPFVDLSRRIIKIEKAEKMAFLAERLLNVLEHV